jgi:hypothetical protein
MPFRWFTRDRKKPAERAPATTAWCPFCRAEGCRSWCSRCLRHADEAHARDGVGCPYRLKSREEFTDSRGGRNRGAWVHYQGPLHDTPNVVEPTIEDGVSVVANKLPGEAVKLRFCDQCNPPRTWPKRCPYHG